MSRLNFVGSFLTVCEHLPLGLAFYLVYCRLPWVLTEGSTCWVCERRHGKDWFFKALGPIVDR